MMLLEMATAWIADKTDVSNFNPLVVIAKCFYFHFPHGMKHIS